MDRVYLIPYLIISGQGRLNLVAFCTATNLRDYLHVGRLIMSVMSVFSEVELGNGP